MQKFIYILLLGLISPSLKAQDVDQLMTLRPGAKLPAGMQLEGKIYKITLKNKLIHSVQISFAEPVNPETYIPPITQGFCLIQKPQDHVNLNRFYFFEMASKRRYELNPLKKIKSILIQDMPGATEHPPCTFNSFNLIQEGT